jgi:two-component system sensor kinase FixL
MAYSSFSPISDDVTPLLLYRAIFDMAFDGICIIKKEGSIFEVNPALCKMLGYSREELLNAPIKKLIHQDHQHKWDEFWSRIAEDNYTPVHVESTNVCKNGKIVYVEVASSLLMFYDQPMVLVIARDITEKKRIRENLEKSVEKRTEELNLLNKELTAEINRRKEIEQALHETKEHYRTLVETIPYGVQDISLTGKVLFANSAAYQIYGARRNKLIGQSIFDSLADEEEKMKVEKYFDTLIKDQPPPTPYFIKLLNKHNRILEIQVDWDYNHDAEGNLVSYVMILTDITEKKRAEEKLREQDLELAHVTRISVAGEMATEMAHELNQPLAAIVNYASGSIRRLESENFDIEKLIKIMQEVVFQAERAGTIIQRMRVFVKKGEPVRREADINEIVQESIRICGFEIKREEVELSLHLSENLPKVYVDQVQISQVFVNIIKNGIEAMEKKKRGEKIITIHTVLDTHNMVKISIKNNGEPMRSEMSEKIFGRFFTTKKEGMGMGLAISRTIIEAHGGCLKLSDESLEDGACFVITLSVATE